MDKLGVVNHCGRSRVHGEVRDPFRSSDRAWQRYRVLWPRPKVAALLGREPRAGHVTTHIADVSDFAQMGRFRDEVADRHAADRIHLLFNNAGIGGGGSLIVNSCEEWERTFNVCWGATAPSRTSRAAAADFPEDDCYAPASRGHRFDGRPTRREARPWVKTPAGRRSALQLHDSPVEQTTLQNKFEVHRFGDSAKHIPLDPHGYRYLVSMPNLSTESPFI